jgi:hypothetical protein
MMKILEITIYLLLGAAAILMLSMTVSTVAQFLYNALK